MDALTAARLRILSVRLRIAKAKGGGKGYKDGQPRYPAGTSLGGQWMGGHNVPQSGIGQRGSHGGFFHDLFGSTSIFGIGAKTWGDPNYGKAEKGPPPHTIETKGSTLHPAKDDHGRAVFIHRPKSSTPPGQWGGKDTTVTVTPGAPSPKALNGIAFNKWNGPPGGDWTKVSGQNAAAEHGMPELEGHKWKHPSAGVIVMEPDGRVWLTSPTNGFGGYRNTFPKGTQEPGLSLQQTAIKEAWEETGLKVRITGVLGDFERTSSIARIYMAERVGGSPTHQGWESQALRLAPRNSMKSFLNMPVDREITDMLWGEHDLTKAKPRFTPEQVARLNDILNRPIFKAKGGDTPGKTGAWTKQPRWPAGTPLGGQWKAYDGDGMPTPPQIGSKSNPGYMVKAQQAYDAVKAGNIDEAVLILKPLELKALALGHDPKTGSYPSKGINSQGKWALQAHQYVTDLVNTNGKAVSLNAKVDIATGPASISDYKKIAPKPGGSNPGAVYEGKDGKWLVKGANHPSDDRAKNEVLSSKLMQAAGIGAPDMKLVKLEGQYGGGLGVMAKMEDMTGWSQHNPQHLEKAQSEFAVHAWLANYDAVGLPAGDNLAMKGGGVFNYDPGGALLYRAQGLPKTLSGGMLSHTVSEWDGMRNKSVNAAAASVYGGMTQDQLKDSAAKLQGISDQTIGDLVAAYGPGDVKQRMALVTALKARRDDILAKAGLIAGPVKIIPAGKVVSAAEANAALAPSTVVLSGSKQWMSEGTKAAYDKTADLILGKAPLDKSEQAMFISMANGISAMGAMGNDEAETALGEYAAQLASIKAHPANGLGQTKEAMTALLYGVANDFGPEVPAVLAPHLAAPAAAIGLAAKAGVAGVIAAAGVTGAVGTTATGKLANPQTFAYAVTGSLGVNGAISNNAVHSAAIAFNSGDAAGLAKEIGTLKTWGDPGGLKAGRLFSAMAAEKGMVLAPSSAATQAAQAAADIASGADVAHLGGGALKTASTAQQSASGGQVQWQHSLENTLPGHNKFYRVSVVAKDGLFQVVTNWGPIGHTGQTNVVSNHSTLAGATGSAAAIAKVKLGKGYQTTSLQEKPFNLPQPAGHFGGALLPDHAPPGMQASKHSNGAIEIHYGGKGAIFGGENASVFVDKAATVAKAVNDGDTAYAKQAYDSINHLSVKSALDPKETSTDKGNWATLQQWAKAQTGGGVMDNFGAKSTLSQADIIAQVQHLAPHADHSPIGEAVSMAALGISSGNQQQFNAGMEELTGAGLAHYVAPSSKGIAAQAVTTLNGLAHDAGLTQHAAAQAAANVVGAGQASEPLPGAFGNTLGQTTMGKLSNADLGPIPNLKGIVGSKYGVTTYGVTVQMHAGRVALKTGDLPKLQETYNKLKAMRAALPFGSKSRQKVAVAMNHLSDPAVNKLGLKLVNGKFMVAGAPPPSTAFGKAAAVLAGLNIPQDVDGTGNVALKVGQAFMAIEANDKEGFRTALAYLGKGEHEGALGLYSKMIQEGENHFGTGSMALVDQAAKVGKADAATVALDRAKDSALKVLSEATGFTGQGILGSHMGDQTVNAFIALQSGNDKALATAIGAIAMSGAHGSEAVTEKLTQLAEAKTGFPMSTGQMADVTVTPSTPLYHSDDWHHYTAQFNGMTTPQKEDMLQSQKSYLATGGEDEHGDTAKFVAYASAALGKTPDEPAGLNLAPLPKAPTFVAGVTQNTTAFYEGLKTKMDVAYMSGDSTALQDAASKFGQQGVPVWPVNKQGLPKTANGKAVSEYHAKLVEQLNAAKGVQTQTNLEAHLKVPEQGTNIGNLPAMPNFQRQKLTKGHASNMASHNGKVDKIEALATKGDVKGLLALNYGTNTYGKKQAALANSALSAMGSPFQVDIGQKKNSHPALSGSMTAAAVTKTAALTAKDLPGKTDFANYNGMGKGLSSSAHVNNANQHAYDSLTDLAMAGDVNGIKSATFQPINKETGQAVGGPLPISQHPSQHVKNHQEFLLQAIDEKLNPPKPLEIFEAKMAASSVAKVAAKFPPKPLGITSKKVPSSQAIGHYIALGQVTGADALVPKKTNTFTPAQKAQAKGDVHKWDSLANSFRSKVQGHGGHEYHYGWDDASKPAKPGSSYTGAKLEAEAKAAHKWARKQPAGTTVYKWEGLTSDMEQKLSTAQPGLILQNPAPSCASMSPTATKGFNGSGKTHRWNIIYAEGAKGFNSFASGNHPGEQEVSMLPNHRFMIISHKKGAGYQDFSETTVLLLPPDPSLDSDGYGAYS